MSDTPQPRELVRTVQVTFDCADPDTLAKFWCVALGYAMDPPPPGHDSWQAFLEANSVPREMWNSRSACSDPNGTGPRLFFQRVPEGKQVKNRLHLDVRAAPGLTGEERMAALGVEADRLQRIGATRVRVISGDGFDHGHIVMTDPEGNEFCVD